MARLRSSSASNSAPSRITTLLIHSHTRNAMTPPSVPYVLLYEEKFATYSANPPDASSHSRVASRLPGVIQRNPGWCAFGAAQYRIAIMSEMATTSTGHFAMSHTVTATEPAPTSRPTIAASRQVHTIVHTLSARRAPVTMGSPRRADSVSHGGRPSPA